MPPCQNSSGCNSCFRTCSKYNVIVEWENGEITPEPLSIIAANNPVTCAIYAKENVLLDTPGWKQFKRLAKRAKKTLRAVKVV